MKTLLVGMATLLAVAAISTDAQAQNYPWCANYGGFEGGGTNCGFSTFQQCLATISGMGGFCDRNTQYVPPPGPHPTPLHHRYRKHAR